MNKYLSLALLMVLLGNNLFAQEFHGAEANKIVEGSSDVKINKKNGCIEFFRFQPAVLKSRPVNKDYLKNTLGLKKGFEFEKTKEFKDPQKNSHVKYQLYFKGIPIEGLSYTIHYKNNKEVSANGNIIKKLPQSYNPTFPEHGAIEKAVSLFDSKEFAWSRNKDLYPKAELLFIPVKDTLKLCYKIDIYSFKPLAREFVYIDAISGDVVKRLSRIHDTDIVGTAETQYNGTVNITADYKDGLYTLNEKGRGNGINTYNLNNGTYYSNATNFLDDNNIWDQTNDKVAYDAHFGSEKTYDYYFNKFGRNSIDDNGYALNSYVHFGYNYANAFWDGEKMTYGDGDGVNINPLTSLDIVGHEITHGLTSFTANLEYQNESGALNESFSDIFSICIDFFSNPTTANYLMGEQALVSGTPIRSMENPNSLSDPDTYKGNYWVSSTVDHGGVHTNCSVQNHWFYLLCEGGNDVNDNSDSYVVDAIGIDAAAAIAYRTLTVYLSEYSNYPDARFYSIQSANDLYGECSDEVIQVTNAWYAVGVGEPFNNAVVANFSADQTYSCSAPLTINFANSSVNGDTYSWFVNNTLVSNDMVPLITFDSVGVYNLKLKVDGSVGCIGTDTLEMEEYIVISDIGEPLTPQNEPTTIYGGNGGIYEFEFAGISHLSDGADDGYMDYSCNALAEVTEGKSYPVWINAGDLNQDIYIWVDINNDGLFSDANEKLFTSFGATEHNGQLQMPQGQVFDTPLRLRIGSERSNFTTLFNGTSNTYYGQYEDYSIIIKSNTNAPEADFIINDSIVVVNEPIQLYDNSLNIPTTWDWIFQNGTPSSSTLEDPAVSYSQVGDYEVELTATNEYGSSSVTKKVHVVDSYIMGGTDMSGSDAGKLYDSGGASGNYSNNERNSFTIKPQCAKEITVSINSFSTESSCDYLRIYEGLSNSGTQLASLDGSIALPYIIKVPSASVYIEFSSDGSVTREGYEISWTTKEFGDGNPVEAKIADTDSIIPIGYDFLFEDQSLYEPNRWTWDFGDGQVSTEQHPKHQYQTQGSYTIELIAGNCLSTDTVTRTITVDDYPDISVNKDTIKVNILSGEKLDSSLFVSNLNGGKLAFESELIATYKKEDTNASLINKVIGYTGKSQNDNFIYADVPLYSNDEEREIISVNNQSYQLSANMQGMNIGLGLNVNYYADLVNELYTNGAETVVMNATNIASAIDTLDVIIMDDEGGYMFYYQRDILRSWISKGGFLIIEGDNEINAFNAIIEGSGIQYNSIDLYAGEATIFSHEVTQGISQYYIGQSAMSGLNISLPAERILDDVNGQCYGAVSQLGEGKILAVGDEAFGSLYDIGHRELLINSINWGSNSSTAWISVLPGTRIVEAGNTDSLKYSINTDNLIEGEYIADMRITCNDINSPATDIPLLLYVTGVEDIKSGHSSINFPKVFVDNTDSLSFYLYNNGTCDLAINKITCGLSEVAIEYTPGSITPNDKMAVKVKFHPTQPQVYTDTIRIESSDPDTPVLSIPFSGSAVTPPVMEITDHLEINLYSDETADTTIAISNLSGGSALALDSIYIKEFTTTQGIIRDTTSFDMSGHRILMADDNLNNLAYLMTRNGAVVEERYLDTLHFDYDVMRIFDYYSYRYSVDHLDYASRWIDNGGGMYCDFRTADGNNTLQNYVRDNFGVRVVNITGSIGGQISVSDHEIMNQITTFPLSQYYAKLEIDGDAEPLLTDSYGNILMAAVKHGDGRIILSTLYYTLQVHNTIEEIFAFNSMRWLANKNSWIWTSEFPKDSIQAGDEHNLKLHFDAANRPEDTYQAKIYFVSNDPANTKHIVNTTLNVTGIPKLELVNDTLNFGLTYNGYSKTDSVLLYNSGTKELDISNILISDSVFQTNNSPFSLLPRESKIISVTYTPDEVASHLGYVVFENNTLNGSDTLFLSGYAEQPPVMEVRPAQIDLKLRTEDTSTKQIIIDNKRGASELAFEVKVEYPEGEINSSDISEVLSNLNQGYDDIIQLIPDRFNFSGGESGYNIYDGGNDMYDTGNFLNTDFRSSIYYSDNIVNTSSYYFGTGGKYFTRKYNGLFVMVADMQSVNKFYISGGLGADGSATADGSVLTLTKGQKTYKGFVKRVYGTSEPSVNHLVIIEDNNIANHTYDTYTNYDTHNINNLNGVERIYYLLFAGNNGSYINDDSIKQIMSTFLQVAEGNIGWATPDITEGTVAAGDTAVVDLLIQPEELEEGFYTAQVNINSNDPASVNAYTLVNLEVNNNLPPYLASPIGNKSVYLTYNESIDISSVFDDPDNDQLFYEVTSTDNNIVFPVMDNGSLLKMKPLAEGLVTINISATDNNWDPVTYSFDVLVQGNNKPIVTNAIDNVNLTIGDPLHIINLDNCFNDPDGDDLLFTKEISQSNIINEDLSGSLLVFTPSQKGSCIVTLNASDDKGGSATHSFAVSVSDLETDISNIEPGDHFILYPNPVKSELQISVPDYLSINSIELKDISGKNLDISYDKNEKIINLNLDHVKNGVYFIILNTNKGTFIRKIIKE